MYFSPEIKSIPVLKVFITPIKEAYIINDNKVYIRKNMISKGTCGILPIFQNEKISFNEYQTK